MSGPKRIPEIQARLERWALWKSSAGSGGGGGGTWLSYMVDLAAGRRVHDDTVTHTTMVPVDDIECSRTDQAVRALPPDLQRAVHAWHLARTGTLDEVARRLGVVKTTLWRRLGQADHRIAEFLSACRSRNN